MLHAERLSIALTAVLALVCLAPRAHGQDRIVRGQLAYVNPSAVGLWRSGGTSEFLDPARPPLGRFDSTELSRFRAGSDLGIGLGFEHKLGGLVGIDASFSYARLVAQASYSGEVVYTPYRGAALTPVPEDSQVAPITGAGAGRIDQWLATVGLHFHVLRRKGIDLYAGPLVGVSFEHATFDHGEFRAVFTWVSRTPLQGREESRRGLAWGGVVGVDLPLGGKGWLASAAARYVSTGSLDPALLQVSLGYRF